MGRKRLAIPDDVAAILRAEYPCGKTSAIAEKLKCSLAKVRAMAEKIGLEKDSAYKREQNVWRAESLKRSREEQAEPKERIRKIPNGIEHRCL